MIRVLVVEDSPTVLALLTALLEEDPDIRVVGQAINGQLAVDLAQQLQPDLITMDVEMPDMDGLEATRRIMAWKPTPILIITAHANTTKLNLAFEAMKAGALDLMSKPSGLGSADNSKWDQELIDKVKKLSQVRPRNVNDLKV